jgi:hypothetical protein
LLTLSLVPLTLGIVIDAYLIGWLILRREAPSLWLAGGLFVALLGLWFALPQVAKRARLARSRHLEGLPASNIEV